MLALGAESTRGQAVNLTDLRLQANRESNKDALPGQGKNPRLLINKTADGKELKFGDASYSTGLEIHGGMSWSYELEGGYSSLVMEVGRQGAVAVRVSGDGNLLYDSGLLPTKGPVTAVLDVRGRRAVKFDVIDLAAGGTAVIGNPVLLKRPAPDAVDALGKSGAPAPQAILLVSTTEGAAPVTAAFTGAQSKSPAVHVQHYTWYFGDGETGADSPNPTHTYAAPGLYEVLLKVEDDAGRVGVARQIVAVPGARQPPRPVLKTSARVIHRGEPVQFDGSGSSSPDGAVTNYHWDFGDGQTGEGKQVKHVYEAAGWHSAVLTVLNRGGNKAQTAVSIKVKEPSKAPEFALPKRARILIIGSSRSGGLANWLQTFDRLSPQPLELICSGKGKGLGRLSEYATWSSLAIHDIIDEGWDVVIIQPGFDLLDANVSNEQLLEDCRTLVGWAREVGAFPVLYEPHHSFRNLARDQFLAHERIARLADQLDTGFVPAGQAWLRVAKDLPLSEAGRNGGNGTDPETLDGLMYGDHVHPSESGSLVNAMMLWKYLTGQPPTALGLSPTDSKVAGKKVIWNKLPYLEKVADEAIMPASQRAP